MKNEDIKRRIKKLEAKLPLANPNGEAILQLLQLLEHEDFLEQLKKPLTEAEKEDLKQFLNGYRSKETGGAKI